MVFRLIGVLLVIFSMLLWIWALIVSPHISVFHALFKIFPYLFMGLLSFGLSQILAKLVCRGFDKDE